MPPRGRPSDVARRQEQDWEEARREYAARGGEAGAHEVAARPPAAPIALRKRPAARGSGHFAWHPQDQLQQWVARSHRVLQYIPIPFATQLRACLPFLPEHVENEELNMISSDSLKDHGRSSNTTSFAALNDIDPKSLKVQKNILQQQPCAWTQSRGRPSSVRW